jgi:hypothetical protein
VRKPEGAPERSPKAGESAPSGVDADRPKRFSVQRKMAIVARLSRNVDASAHRGVWWPKSYDSEALAAAFCHAFHSNH